MSDKHLSAFSNDCFICRYATDEFGYAHFKMGGHSQAAHRIAYQIFNGPIRNNWRITHTCGNKACINPRHLLQESFKQNVKRGGRKSKIAALPPEQLSEILTAEAGTSNTSLARKFGVSTETILRVRKPRAYAWRGIFREFRKLIGGRP